ncbi:unnamed protein product [Bursaphelenchus okinawaensis]|uniref:Uncharacterized protein n=1 Tax=Bursaphelenchus okinawaensis TaxID=465554 RepID=A0A811JT14_9BILA|nr:unnamed protein product [Bursaphelenchus okinawaensis]CAG9081172.1 unnamed protein product [Bursaphelenchus okinawaensis]
MLDGVYSYFFGSEQSTADAESNEQLKGRNDEWIMVDPKSGRSSPVMVDEPVINELDDMTSEVSSQMNQPVLTATEIRKRAKAKALMKKEEQKRKVKATIQQRQWLEEKLFEDPDAETNDSPPSSVQNSPPGPQKPLDKLIMSQPMTRKQKQRSKKAGSNSSGRSNDRKCNNIN